MKTAKLDTATSSTLLPLIKHAGEGATHFRVIKEGGKRGTYEPFTEIEEAEANNEGFITIQDPCEILPVLKKGSKWVDVGFINDNPPKQKGAKKAAKKTPKKAAKVKKDEKKSSAPTGTGYVAFIRDLLLDKTGKYEISEVIELVLEKFPDKEPKSIRRISYNQAKIHGVKWKTASNKTGFMAKVDALLEQGDLTTRLIGEKLAVEEGRDVKKTKAVVRARFRTLLRRGRRISVPAEIPETKKTTFLPE